MNEKIIKYPRTPHIEGSRLQDGDEDLGQIPFSHIAGRKVIVEEKVDGANVGISFYGGDMYLQSRGHFLRGGAREREYELFKLWAGMHRDELFGALGERYIMYGEWLYRKHRVYYNALPHYFLEFDIYDKETGVFLDTPSRKALLSGTSVISVPVLFDGVIRTRNELLRLIGKSKYITVGHTEELIRVAQELGLDAGEVLRQTDESELCEGLYIKLEDGGRVCERMKYVRHGYAQVASNDARWHAERIIPNRLTSGSIFD